MENQSKRNWIILAVGIIVIGLLTNLIYRPINSWVVSAAQGSGFARTYLGIFYGIDKETRINGQTPIQYAIQSLGKLTDEKRAKLEPVINQFISNGVDINASSSYGFTALHYAIASEDVIALNMLIEKGAAVNQPAHIEDAELNPEKAIGIEGKTPLKYLLDRKAQKKVKSQAKVDEMEKILRDKGANE